MNVTPCGHLRAGPMECIINRRFPDDCPGCAAYVAGRTDEERRRCEVWAAAARPRPESVASWINCSGCPSLLLYDEESDCARQVVPGGAGCWKRSCTQSV